MKWIVSAHLHINDQIRHFEFDDVINPSAHLHTNDQIRPQQGGAGPVGGATNVIIELIKIGYDNGINGIKSELKCLRRLKNNDVI